MRLLLWIFLFLIVSISVQARAQESVVLRAAEHDGYSRLVFDWPTSVGFQKKEENGVVRLTFERVASLDTGGAVTASRISAFEILGSDPLSVSFTLADKNTARVFAIGSRVIVDITGPPGRAIAPPPEPSPAPPPAPAKTEQKPDPVTTPPATDRGEISVKPAPALAELPVVPVQRTEKITGTNLLTISATRSARLSAFMLDGHLWLVNDQPDLLLSPQLSGPQKDAFVMARATAPEGTEIFKIPGMTGLQPSAQGGGLVWRLFLSGHEESRTPVNGQRLFNPQGGEGRFLWPVKGAGSILEIEDTAGGLPIHVVTVESADFFSGPAQNFVEFDLLRSSIGLAVLAKVDDLSVTRTEEGILITRPGGLALSSPLTVKAAQMADAREKDANPGTAALAAPGNDVFDFENWKLGDINALEENALIILSGLAEMSDSDRVENILTLGRMYLAHGMWAESLGFLKYAQDELPELTDNPRFQALVGAVKSLGGANEEAFAILMQDSLSPFEEIKYWQAFTLSNLGDWQQARALLPADVTRLRAYPEAIRNMLAVGLAEVSLRAGDVAGAERYLGLVDGGADTVFSSLYTGAYQYLQGEAERQKGQTDKTLEMWSELAQGDDDYYRVRASLALVRLRMEQDMIEPAEAIDTLERLRYMWRGDELEAQVNYWLGDSYFKKGEYAKGLTILRDAAGYAAGTELGSRIAANMSDLFSGLFLGENLKDVTPQEAAALYENFTELVTPDDTGNKIIRRLAEHLVDSALFSRAADLLQYQLNHRVKGEEALGVAIRLAAIRLLDNQPEKALTDLEKAKSLYDALPDAEKTLSRPEEISLLRARGLSRIGRSDQAIALLEDLSPTPDVNRLRADIAWNAGYWDDAADALEDVILDANISRTRPLEVEEAGMILNRAIALNLSNDRIGLANMRQNFSQPMAQTEQGRIFDVITRPRQNVTLADRETMMSVVAEVDLFKGFLDNYTKPQTEAE